MDTPKNDPIVFLNDGTQNPIRVLLADDDKDDCMLFEEALQELPIRTHLTTVYNGVLLMELLDKKDTILPDILFLDLNMPLKNGFDCLDEIRNNKNTAHLFVVIFSTSSGRDIVNRLYSKGAHYYIRKPTDFANIKEVILRALTKVAEKRTEQPSIANFLLAGDI